MARAFPAAATIVAILLSPLAAPIGAAGGNMHGAEEVIVALIDSGVRATHIEFDYRGHAAADDQIVAWWDFSAERAPAHRPPPGALWDPLVLDPYDVRGHGTGTAALAVGLNADPFKVVSHCPGCKLAIAKVTEADGRIAPETTTAAIRWAVEDVGADVISISIGFSILGTGIVTGGLIEIDEAIAAAREAGVLVLVAAGNGPLNRGGPGHFSWLQGSGHSTSALIVGGSSIQGGTPDGASYSHDPEVVAHATSVRTAAISSDSAYATGSGSSYATPLVAGMAARALRAGIAAGCAPDADALEDLLKGVARDTLLPPTFEGHGFLGAVEADRAESLSATCAPPPAPAPINAAHERAAEGIRWLASDGGDTEAMLAWTLGGPASTPDGVLAAGAGQGAFEIEIWRVALAEGERLSAALRLPDASPLRDVELFLFRPGAEADGIILGGERLASSTFASNGADRIAHRASAAGTYLLVASAALAHEEARYELDVSVDGATPPALAADGRIAIGTTYYG